MISFHGLAQRNMLSLNAGWEFNRETEMATQQVNLPHTWNWEDPFRNGKEYFRGKGPYKKRLFVPGVEEQPHLFAI